MTPYKPYGQYLTGGLFLDKMIRRAPADREQSHPPVFTLHDEKPGLVCFGKTYISLRDKTGYKITQELLYSDYRHWQELMKSAWFIRAKASWDEEIDQAISSEMSDKLLSLAQGDDAKALTAAKYLHGLSTTQKRKSTSRGAGRPSSDEIEGAIKEEVKLSKEFQEDIDRITKLKAVS